MGGGVFLKHACVLSWYCTCAAQGPWDMMDMAMFCFDIEVFAYYS